MFRNRNVFIVLGGVVVAGALLLVFALRGFSESEPSEKPLKIAVVDTQQVFDQYIKTKEANKTLEEAVKRLEEQGKTINDELVALEEKLTKQRLFVDDPKRLGEMEAEIRRKREELRRLIETGQEALSEKRDELAEPILKEIRETTRELGQREGYSLILEKQLIALYHKPEMDITERLIALLHERAAKEGAEGKQTEPASKAPKTSGEPTPAPAQKANGETKK